MKKEQKLNDKIAAGLADATLSPAVLGLQMTRESAYVNEAFISYFVNYVIMMSEKNLIPFQMKEVYNTCVALRSSFQELGLTGLQAPPLDSNEYLAV